MERNRNIQMVITTYTTDNTPKDDSTLVVSELDINKCKGCLRCRQLGKCAWFNDDAARLAPVIAEAQHLDLYLQKDGNLSLLINRVLFAITKSQGKTYTLHIQDNTEEEYICRCLDWCGYQQLRYNKSLFA